MIHSKSIAVFINFENTLIMGKKVNGKWVQKYIKDQNIIKISELPLSLVEPTLHNSGAS